MEGENSTSEFSLALRKTRLLRGLSVVEVSKILLLSDKQIVGLENDDFVSFYSLYFAEKSAAKYAEFLGLDIELYKDAPRTTDPARFLQTPVIESFESRDSRRRVNITATQMTLLGWVCAAALSVLIAFLIFQFLRTIF